MNLGARGLAGWRRSRKGWLRAGPARGGGACTGGRGAHLSLESQLASGASQFSASILRAAIWAEVRRPAWVQCDRAAFLFNC